MFVMEGVLFLKLVMKGVLMQWIRFFFSKKQENCISFHYEERKKYEVGITRIPRKQPTPTHTHIKLLHAHHSLEVKTARAPILD